MRAITKYLLLLKYALYYDSEHEGNLARINICDWANFYGSQEEIFAYCVNFKFLTGNYFCNATGNKKRRKFLLIVYLMLGEKIIFRLSGGVFT